MGRHELLDSRSERVFNETYGKANRLSPPIELDCVSNATQQLRATELFREIIFEGLSAEREKEVALEIVPRRLTKGGGAHVGGVKKYQRLRLTN